MWGFLRYEIKKRKARKRGYGFWTDLEIYKKSGKKFRDGKYCYVYKYTINSFTGEERFILEDGTSINCKDAVLKK